MIIVDAQLSPRLASWIKIQFSIEAVSLREINLLNAEDRVIFDKGREMNAIIMTKDEDFIQLLHREGSPPKVLWITCGNTSNIRMMEILRLRLSAALDLFNISDLVEISD